MKDMQEKESQVDTPPQSKTQIVEYLQSYVPAEFPTDRPRNQTSPERCGMYNFTLARETYAALNRFAQTLSVDPGIVLLAAIRMLHFSYSRINQCAIGLRTGVHSPLLSHPSSQPGGTIVLCLPVEYNEPFVRVTERTVQAIRAASQFSESVWLDAIAELSWNQSDKNNQFIPIIVTLDNLGSSNDADAVPTTGRALFDTEWRFNCVGETVGCNLTYSYSRFKVDSIRALADNFTDVLHGLLFESESTFEAIFFSHALQQLKQGQIPTERPLKAPRSPLVDAFATTAVDHQEEIALVDGDLSFTYRELDILSSALAAKISETARGEKSYELISFCIPPSAITIVAILGITKYGAAYAPLDVRFPKERLSTLLNDSAARLLITTSESPEVETEPTQVTRLDISEFLTDWRSLVASFDASALAPHPSLTDLACIMYTSGSTGKPKGVAIKQSSIVALVSNKDILSFNPGDRVAQITNIAWDASIVDIWCTLLSGATLVCFNRYDVLDPAVLALQFKSYAIDRCIMTPALCRQVVASTPALFLTLKTLILGGESIYYESIRQLREINPSLTIQNGYGPTEACVVTTMFTVNPEDDIPVSGPVPIGRPLKTSQVLVVDGRGRLVPPGVVGELVIGGEGVARGYLNRPAETAQAFVEMEFEGLDQPREVFYHSGDTVKWRLDGQLEFVGRLNVGQVKIRGQRLELTEIEAAIMRTGLANSIAVTAHQPANGRDPSLVAYVVLESLSLESSTRPIGDLIERLKTILPPYMIPAKMYSIRSLPLLSTGKLDRNRISDMAAADISTGFDIQELGASGEPEDALEKRVCEIFGTVVSAGFVPPTADFFSLGGHSLLANGLKVALETEFGVRVTLEDLFAGPTPRSVASRIRDVGPGGFPRIDVKSLSTTAVTGGAHHHLSFAQGRLWFLAQVARPEDVSYNSPVIWELSGDLRVDTLERTIKEVCSRHEILRTIFVEAKGVPKSQVLDILPSLDTVDVSAGTNPTQLHEIVLKSAMRPFHLDSEPAFRATLFQVSPGRSILLLAMHHIVWDAYSIDVLRDEFEELYNAFSQGKNPSLPPLHIQYKEFAQWQHSPEFEDLVRPQVAYWKTYLAGSQPAELPTDYPRPPHRTGRASSYISPCSQGTLERLQDICLNQRVTMFMWLLTVFRIAHYQLTQQEDASLGYPIANRNRLETGKMLGFFVNTQVFRLKIHPGVTFLELLQCTKESLQAAYENEDLPFDKLVSILNPGRDLSRNPLVQIMCTHETAQTFSSFSSGGIDVGPYRGQSSTITTRLDLEVYFRTRDGELHMDIYYSTDLFKASKIVYLAQRVQTLLAQTIQEPNFSVIPDEVSIYHVQPIIGDLITYLDGYVPAEFPLDYHRSLQAPFEHQVHHFELPKEARAPFRFLATVGGVSAQWRLLAAACRILHFRYSRREDAAIGLSITDATLSYCNPVVVRLPTGGSVTLSNVQEETRHAIDRVSKYSDIPFSEMATDVHAYGSAACDSIVHVVLSLSTDVSDRGIISQNPRVSFDMEWQFFFIEGACRCDLVYNGALFKRESIQALSINFIDIVNSLLRKPKITVDAIPFSQSRQLLQQFQIPTEAPPPISRSSLVEAFNITAIEHKEKIALIDGQLSLTYRMLDILSSILANKISATALGGEKYKFIALCIPSSAVAVLAILGIIKYGAAYVPLDVRFPQERLDALMDDSAARLLITTSESPEVGIEPTQVARLDISEFLTDWRSLVASLDKSALSSFPSLTDLAYIMYTSGSTGKPKGVAIKQSSIVALVSNKDILSFNPGDRVAQIANIAWDASIIDIWCTLLSGATLVCFNRYDVLDPDALALQFNSYAVDCCFMTPALCRQVVASAPALFLTLKTLILGGESIYYESIRQLREINPSLTVQNVYGPTETCVVTTTFTVNPGDGIPESGPVPIGRPLKTSQVLVVDSRGWLVPPGVVGELVIGGEGVARGYLNRPAETAQAFVEMEFEGLDQHRAMFYSSGDVVKWRSDGQLQFVDRLNIGQVKIRGQRLELAEVEAAIIGTGLVGNTAVTYHKPDDGRDPFLIAYIVTNPDSGSSAGEKVISQGDTDTKRGTSKLVETWRELYDDMYSSYDMIEARSKFLGWDSMITGLPIPHDEMTAWLHDTLRPFFQRRPRTVFEVGCGIGIILYEMAPFVEHLWAIEPSGEAVSKLNAQLQETNMIEKFSIYHGPADHIPELPPFNPEFVLINSVVQYLPSEAYLRDILLHIVDRCVPGSQILIGDVRSLPFDDLLGIDVVLHEWKDELHTHTIDELRNRIVTRNQNRTELLVDPTFFLDLQRLAPAIGHVEILPKVLEKSNELGQFRYQVILHVGQGVPAIVPEKWYDYQNLKWDASSFEKALNAFIARDDTVLAIERIPNKFLAWEESVASIVFSRNSNPLESLASLPPKHSWMSTGWSAWDIERLAQRFGLEVRLSFTRQSQSTALDVAFVKPSTADTQYVLFKTVEKADAVATGFSSRSLEQLKLKSSTRSERDVLQRLKAILPAYMIPEAIYSIPNLPLLSNGKLDRRQISAMAIADAERVSDVKTVGISMEPEDELEKRVCEIFETTLSLACGVVSPQSDFFSIGGHSLLATRLKAAIEGEFGVRVTVQELFTGPTPRNVATRIRRFGLPSVPCSGTSIAGLGASSEGRYHPLSFAQGRLWFLAQVAGPNDVSYNSPLIWELSGDLHLEALERTIQEIVSRHEILRTIFVDMDGTPKTQVLDIAPTLHKVDITPGISSNNLDKLIWNSAMQPLLIDSEPAFRATLFRISPCRSIILFSVHHIIWDGYSIDVLRDEFEELYNAFSQGKIPSLPSLHIQYKEFAQWQHSPEFEDLVRPQVAYWKTYLAGSQPAELPTDYPRPPHRTGRASSYISPCSQGTLERLQDICLNQRVTMFMWLLTVFRIAHYQLTQQEDASLGYPIANRNRLETGKMLGFFVNTQVFRLKIHPGVTFLELLQCTKESLQAAYENEDLPFDKLVSILNPGRDLSRNPLVQIMCTHETAQTFSSFSSGGIDVGPYRGQSSTITTRLDLEVYFRTRDGELHMDIYYSTDLFKEASIANLSQKVQMLLAQTIEDSDFSVLLDQGSAYVVKPIVRDLITYLDGYVPAEFPLDYPRVLDTFSRSQIYSFELPREICVGLEVLLTLKGVKEASLVLLSALRILHFRFSRVEDTVMGLCATDASASPPNIAVVRLPINGHATLLDVEENTRNAVADVSKYSNVPFSDIAAALHLHDSAACDSIIHLVLSLSICETRAAVLEKKRMHFDMEWQFSFVKDVFKCDLIYNDKLFKQDSIQAFASSFIHIVKALLWKSTMTVEAIPWGHSLSHTLQLIRQAQIPIEPPPLALRGSLAEALKATTVQHKETIALIDARLNFTYHELDVLSSALAKKISETTHGEEKYKLISFCIPPSALAILAILGIIKYGAAYVPLDVRFPNERLATLLDDSGARLLITTFASPKFETHRSQVTLLDISHFLTDYKAFVASLKDSVLPTYPSQTDLAYVMYTSGSTGNPKGVAIKQSSVLAFVSNKDVFSFGPNYIVAQLNNLAWDASIIDVWFTLLSGATLVCFNRYDILDGPVLAMSFRALRIDCCFMSSALFRQVLDSAPELFRKLKTLILGGETIYYESLQQLREINPSLTIHSVYGTTETCVLSTAFTIYPSDEMPDSGPVPIGRPLKSDQVLVLDESGCLVPPGAVGELVIGGEGVALGYLNRPAETSHAFVEMEIEGLDQPRSRFYHSGDAVKWRSDGQLEFVSRRDIGQVKIRGQRLEMAEVEATIIRSKLVTSAAVTYHRPADGRDPFLVAYIVDSLKRVQSDNDSNAPMATCTNNSENVRSLQRQLLDYLQRSVPSFMVPQVIRTVSSLPLLPTGKLDRRQLEVRTAADAEGLRTMGEQKTFEAPRDDIERQLCEIFEQVLECAPMYPSSDFFASGGHSLLAQRLSVQVRRAFNVPLRVEDVFQSSTPKELADKVRISIPREPMEGHVESSSIMSTLPSEDSCEDPTPDDGNIPPLLIFSQKPSTPYLFCAPMANGLGYLFAALSRLASRINVVALHHPRYSHTGLNLSLDEYNEVDTFPGQATYYYDLIVQTIGDLTGGATKATTPVNILGFSFGGIPAIEVARIALREGWKVNLFVVDSSALPIPQYANLSEAMDDVIQNQPGLNVPDRILPRFREVANAVTHNNVRALAGYTMTPYPSHITLFLSEGNLCHGFNSFVESFDELVVRGSHHLLLDESTGNLGTIAEKIYEVLY